MKIGLGWLTLAAALTVCRLAEPRVADALLPIARGAAVATEVDGDAAMDATGALRPDPALLALFDYVLSNATGQSRAALNQSLRHILGTRLPQSARAQVLDLFRRTLDYRAQLYLAARAHAPMSLARRWAWEQRLRARFFTSREAQALFATADQFDRLALARQAVIENLTLDADEHQRQLNTLEQQLPPILRQMRAQTRLPLQLARAERLLLLRQGGERDLFLLRRQWVGNAAALRLTALDQEHQVWLRRVADYRAARQALSVSPGLSGDALKGAQDDLTANLFTPNERLRLAAYLPGEG